MPFGDSDHIFEFEIEGRVKTKDRSGLSHCLGRTGSQAAGSKDLAPSKVRLTYVRLAMTEWDRAFDLISP